MQLNPVKIKQALDKEHEAKCKMNSSSVVPVDWSGQYPVEPTRLIKLHEEKGVVNNRKQTPRTSMLGGILAK